MTAVMPGAGPPSGTERYSVRQVASGSEQCSGQSNAANISTVLLPVTEKSPRANFGEGRDAPYGTALRHGEGRLKLVDAVAAAQGDWSAAVDFDVRNWLAAASPLEVWLLAELGGPLLDIGCGPGRFVAAAAGLGMVALGIDSNADAVAKARNAGAQALCQSVFAPVPGTGMWAAGLLLDGNIGIGGDASLLLQRCRELLATGGALLVEVDTEDSLDIAYWAVLQDQEGRRSEPFAWARLGCEGLAVRARRTGWSLAWTRRIQGRVFCRLEGVPRIPASSR